jgi:hypothetical protein
MERCDARGQLTTNTCTFDPAACGLARQSPIAGHRLLLSVLKVFPCFWPLPVLTYTTENDRQIVAAVALAPAGIGSPRSNFQNQIGTNFVGLPGLPSAYQESQSDCDQSVGVGIKCQPLPRNPSRKRRMPHDPKASGPFIFFYNRQRAAGFTLPVPTPPKRKQKRHVTQ